MIKGNSRSFNKEKIDVIVNKLDKQPAIVTKIEKKMKKSYSPGLYDLTELTTNTAINSLAIPQRKH